MNETPDSISDEEIEADEAYYESTREETAKNLREFLKQRYPGLTDEQYEWLECWT